MLDPKTIHNTFTILCKICICLSQKNVMEEAQTGTHELTRESLIALPINEGE